MISTEDQVYIQKVLQGDTNSFTVLVDKYKDLVFTIAIRMLKNRDEAEEATQDIFIKVYKSLSKFQGNSKFSTWVYRIAYHACLDILKKYKKEKLAISLEDYKGNEVSELESAFQILVQQEQQELIQKCLNLLPYEESILLTLYYYEEQSLEEIAKVLSISSNNAKVKLFRSRKKLETILRMQLPTEIIENYERRNEY
ncbi:MAG: RNA polymerase [Flavobacterium sp.]|uniref:RNA polymerase sigma factor n=1 Tax=unclassified Flavobacterium TaxID=196869 RepID=UPI000C66A2C0|nr:MULTISPECIES: RNA polymerase sigma factor [unclassified Flavobacterium]MBF03100.1 RNA polymerase [Flavobacterium sp.]MCO6162256.1 RNA polymerase sigma factor [Flavobacterium sp. NRK F7]|tara:strand:+ start:1655 stop:2248 length:594 start_codon:yes stop_codon:yes gene_type:complete